MILAMRFIKAPLLIENCGSRTKLIIKKCTQGIKDKDYACKYEFEYHWLKEDICKVVVVIGGYFEAVLGWWIKE